MLAMIIGAILGAGLTVLAVTAVVGALLTVQAGALKNHSARMKDAKDIETKADKMFSDGINKILSNDKDKTLEEGKAQAAQAQNLNQLMGQENHNTTGQTHTNLNIGSALADQTESENLTPAGSGMGTPSN